MSPSAPAEPPPTIRALTMNVFGPGNPDWERRRRLIGEAIRGLEPDVIALQEVPVDAPDTLESLIGPGYHLTHFSRPSADGVAGTLATRLPHRLITEIDLRISNRSRRALPWSAAVLVEVDTPLGPLVVAHHKPSWPLPYELEREQQAVLVARAVEAHVGDRDLHALVLGDLDATPESAGLRFLRGEQPLQQLSVCYQDAWEHAHPGEPGYTFDRANPLVRDGEFTTTASRRIDYVLVRSGPRGPTLRVADCRRVLDGPVDGVWASDHYGVVADLVAPASLRP